MKQQTKKPIRKLIFGTLASIGTAIGLNLARHFLPIWPIIVPPDLEAEMISLATAAAGGVTAYQTRPAVADGALRPE